MPDNASNRPLTDQALARLRKLAEGNGLAPDKIELIDTHEQTYKLEGFTQLVPFCDPSSTRYVGSVRGRDRTSVQDIAALNQAIEQHQKSFFEGKDWFATAKKELEAAPGGGWGLDGAKITLPEKSVIFAANEVCPACHGNKTLSCPQCQGQGMVACNYCDGRGQEVCYNCSGRGVNPAYPNQPCAVCHGKQYVPCRFCYHSSGKSICSTCQGKRGLVCSNCQGHGHFTVEMSLACGAAVHFRFGGQDLPSGLRRGLDRLGVANLVKGHADVRTLPDASQSAEKPDEKMQKDETPKTADSVLIRYEATMPYADLKIRFGDARAVIVNVFGKRGSLLGVPPFLDESLKPWRERLQKSARGQTSLQSALDARAMKDAFKLILGNQGQVNNLRRLYPVGLSPKTAQEILSNMRAALHYFTRSIRMAASIGSGLLGAALLAAFVLLPFHARLLERFSMAAGFAIDFVVLLAVLGLCWATISKSVQFKLRQSFPEQPISLRGTTGYIGKATLAGVAVIWCLLLVFAPERTAWVANILSRFHH